MSLFSTTQDVLSNERNRTGFSLGIGTVVLNLGLNVDETQKESKTFFASFFALQLPDKGAGRFLPNGRIRVIFGRPAQPFLRVRISEEVLKGICSRFPDQRAGILQTLN